MTRVPRYKAKHRASCHDQCPTGSVHTPVEWVAPTAPFPGLAKSDCILQISIDNFNGVPLHIEYRMSDKEFNHNAVETTVKLTGRYENIAQILGESANVESKTRPVADDLAVILDIVDRTGGATKSQIAEEASGDVTADIDGDSVIHALRLLALYDLVTLDGNTWRPGPAQSSE